MSIKSEVTTILADDAQINNVANLGGSTMLNQSGSSPFGFYYHHPPVDPATPFLTYHMGTAIGEQPRMTALYVNTWGQEDDEIVLIADRVHTLLHRQQLLLTAYRFLQLIWDWHSDEIWHDQSELYNREDRYLVKTWKV